MLHTTRYAFFGTPEFAAIILEKLIKAGMPPVAVVCNPDRPVGRKKIITSPPTKKITQKFNIVVLQPEELDRDFKARIASFNCDFFVVAAYAKIIPKEILYVPPLGVIGVHPSLLPKYRGASPIQSAILSGDYETGVTLYLLDEKVDHGQLLASTKCDIADSDTFETLIKKLGVLGGDLLVETLPKFLKSEITPIVQNQMDVTYTKKFAAEDAFIDEKDLKRAMEGGTPPKAVAMWRKIRALNPEPGVWTMQAGKRVKLLEAKIRDGKLVLKKIQEEGGKPKAV